MENKKLIQIQRVNRKTTRLDFVKKMAYLSAVLPFSLQYCSKYPDNQHSAKPCISFEITFSESMNCASVESVMCINPTIDNFFSGEFIWSNNNSTVYYKGNVLKKGQLYSITINGTARDLEGDYLDGNCDGKGGSAYSFEVLGV
jgi:hypothetical protein